MSLVVGINSYVTSAEMTAYCSDRLFSSEWDALSLEDQDKACITGTSILDSLCVWSGDKTDEEQSLSFPRDSDTEVPADIKKACFEVILEVVKQQLASFVSAGESLKQLKAGSVSLSFYEMMNSPITVVNSIAKSILTKYGNCNFGGNNIHVVNLSR